ncbi:MAG: class I SAM-dependent methyltransferase [Rhodothalassiaceae bacterium]
MSVASSLLPPSIQAYLQNHSVREAPELAAIRTASDRLPEARMRSSAEQVQFLCLLLQLMQARRVIEVGVFTGYATLGFALALPNEGRVVAMDLTDRWLDEARRQWRRRQVQHKIELRLGAADESLDELIAMGETDSFDFAYIDADKEGYAGYYERCLTLVRTNGLIAIDNTLWSGRVAEAQADDPDTRALKALNKALHGDDRIDLSLIPIGDGVTLARKR